MPESQSSQELCCGASASDVDGRRNGSGKHTLGKIVGAAVAGAAAYSLLIRPWHLSWGATRREAHDPLPGDELLSRALMRTTRAVTIEATPARIWPWLAQIGQGRGGLYSYDWLENLVGCDIHSADHVVPELQNLRVGDAVRLGPEGYPFLTVVSIVPERELVLMAGGPRQDSTSEHDEADGFSIGDQAMERQVPRSSWAFVLRPVDSARTRLLVRFRADWEPGAGATLFNRVLLEPAHFMMERKMILGIKERAERGVAGEARRASGEPTTGS